MPGYNKSKSWGDKGGKKPFRDKPFNRSKSSFGSFKSRNQKPQMHKAICDGCGDKCNVPFKPSVEKPVYCQNCFNEQNKYNDNDNFGEKKYDNKPRRKSDFSKRSYDKQPTSSISKEQFDQLNTKLDKILQWIETNN